MYFDREGKPISQEEWARLFETRSYKVLEQTELLGGRIFVSTVWLGLDHGWGAVQPIIFESMAFRVHKRLPRKEKKRVSKRITFVELATGIRAPFRWQMDLRRELDQVRYATEAEALAGHRAMVRKWVAKK